MKNNGASRIGRQMARAVAYVAANPWCTIADVARHITPCPVPSGNWAYGYNPVHRAISAGLIHAEASPTHRGRYSLTDGDMTPRQREALKAVR